jgi:hypothetical protein
MGVFNIRKANVDAFVTTIIASRARLYKIAMFLVPQGPVMLSRELGFWIGV